MQEKLKILGFDIGITSIGWAFVEGGELKDSGVRIFTKAENPKTGESLALPRRTARGTRRRLHRRKVRLNAIKRLICKEFGLNLADFYSHDGKAAKSTDGELPKAFTLTKDSKSPYQLRFEALSRKLNASEFARVILHIAKHRGYGNKHAKSANEGSDAGKVKAALKANAENLGHFQSVGEYLYKEFYEQKREEFSEKNDRKTQEFKNVRNKAENYAQCMNQAWLMSELELIFKKQREFGWKFSDTKYTSEAVKFSHKEQSRSEKKSENSSEIQGKEKLQHSENSGEKDKEKLPKELEFENKILDLAFWQRPLKSYADKVGECTFFKGEKRAPKDSISAMEQVALTRIINILANFNKAQTKLKKEANSSQSLHFADKDTGEIFGTKHIAKIVNSVLEKGEMNYKTLRKMLNLHDDLKFPNDSKLDYTAKEPENAKFIEFKKLKDFKKALGGSFEGFERGFLDELATQIAMENDKERLKIALTKKFSDKLNETQIKNLSDLNFAKFHNLSLKALNAILPYMREGFRYDEAVARAQERGEVPKIDTLIKKEFLPPLKEYDEYLANPVVARALAEFRKVCNALIKKHGKVHKIHIELTREAGSSKEHRMQIQKEQRENFKANDTARKECENLGLKSLADMLKIKLWKEQSECCIYSGEKITIEHLKDPNTLQIDHIYPYSRSFDDSYMNKVLVFSRTNQDKANKTPFEAFGADKAKWDSILSRANKLPRAKKNRISNANFKDKEAGLGDEFLARNLVDTGYIARLVAAYVADNLDFLGFDENEDTSLARGVKGSKKHVSIISGTLTAVMRHYWGLNTILNKKPRDKDKNLGENSGENAAEKPAEIQNEIANLQKDKDRSNHLHHAIDAIVIAFMNDKIIKNFSDFKKEQELSRAKIYAQNLKESEFGVKRPFFVPCENFRAIVKNAVLGKKDENNGERKDGIFVSKPPRKRVRGALHKESFKSRDDKELLEIYGGELGLQRAIKLGKIRQVGTKLVDNENMVRVDIFAHKNSKKFYAVPIYAIDFANEVLPNKAIVGGKQDGTIKEWLEMDENYQFCFSLFKDDLINIKKDKMEKAELCYFVGLDVSGAKIDVIKHDNYFANLTKNQKMLFTSATPENVKGRGVGIQNLQVFEKHQIDVLGNVSFKADLNSPEIREEIHLKRQNSSEISNKIPSQKVG